MKKFFLSGVILAVLGGIAFWRYISVGAYVDESGFLVEPFAYVPLGFLALFLAGVCWSIALVLWGIKKFKR